ncbi:MAG: hypothetical protein IPO77_09665 [Acidobacteria bacterium]|nr:hypothetical protein [Acidobacteriota bacterium]
MLKNKKTVFTAVLFIIVAWVTYSPVEAQGKTAAGRTDRVGADIRAVLDKQVVAWNSGKLEEFMEGYWKSPS